MLSPLDLFLQVLQSKLETLPSRLRACSVRAAFCASSPPIRGTATVATRNMVEASVRCCFTR